MFNENCVQKKEKLDRTCFKRRWVVERCVGGKNDGKESGRPRIGMLDEHDGGLISENEEESGGEGGEERVRAEDLP